MSNIESSDLVAHGREPNAHSNPNPNFFWEY